jgi:hypothetical protein
MLAKNKIFWGGFQSSALRRNALRQNEKPALCRRSAKCGPLFYNLSAKADKNKSGEALLLVQIIGFANYYTIQREVRQARRFYDLVLRGIPYPNQQESSNTPCSFYRTRV